MQQVLEPHTGAAVDDGSSVGARVRGRGAALLRRRGGATSSSAMVVLGLALAVVVGAARDMRVTGLAVLLVSIVALLAIAVGVRRHRPENRRFWGLCAAAISTGIMAGVLTAVLPQTTTTVTAIDLVYLGGFTLFVVAGFSAVPRRGARHDLAGLLDALTIGLGAAAAFWYVGVSPTLASDPDLHGLVTGVVWPVYDVVLVVVLVRLVATASRTTFPMVMIALCLASSVLTDFVYAAQGGQMWGGALDPLWVLPMATFGAAALHPDMRFFGEHRRGEPVPITAPWLFVVGVVGLGIPLIVGVHAYLVGRLLEETPVILSFVTVLVVASVARSAEMVRQAVLTSNRLEVANSALTAALRERDELFAEMSYRARHDPLTGLANRAELLESVDAVMTDRRRSGRALMFLDLDEFKVVNDTLGHQAGDEVLVELGRRIRAVVRPDDLVARLGGDEFAILLGPVDHQLAHALGQRLLGAVAKPFLVAGQQQRLGASIGLAWADRAAGSEDLIRCADVAMYQVKSRGKNGFTVFDASRADEALRPVAG